jgi:excisionase family DNA binding protein
MTVLNECQTFTVAEAARLLGLGRSATYDGCKSGTIPAIRIGRRILVPKQALEKMLVYGKTSVDAWLVSQESEPVRARRSKGGRS